MNDQPPAQPLPPKPRPPSGGNGAPPRRRSPRTPPPKSRESRFIGYLVLGFGVLAVIAVLVLALGKKDPASVGGDNAQQAATPREIATDMQSMTPQEKKPGKTDLYFERDKDFNAGRMEGDWQASIGRYTAVLQIRKNVFQIILASPDPAAPRYYSSGTFQVADDIIMLTPRMDWPQPAAPKDRAIAYSKLTRAPFPVIARFDGEKMLWQNAPQSEKRVSAPYTSPIFKSSDVKVAQWQRLN